MVEWLGQFARHPVLVLLTSSRTPQSSEEFYHPPQIIVVPVFQRFPHGEGITGDD